ncbi:MAG: hypothetical protein NTW96_27465 [Planctomycetia bacterium]|nr:hypothetical protein [Planctomycetia bacterium]
MHTVTTTQRFRSTHAFTGLPPFSEAALKTGDILLMSGDGVIGTGIQVFTGDEWTHAALVVDGEVWEQTWPKIKHTPIALYLRREAPVAVLPCQQLLGSQEETHLENWWLTRLGNPYDWALLLAEAPASVWQRISRDWSWLPFSWRRIQPIAGENGVCSVCVAWSLQSIGIPMDETTGMTPGDLIRQQGFGPLSKVVLT